jgi:hypothetical protein
MRPLTRSQKRAHNKRKREEAAAAAGAFRPPPGLRLRAGAEGLDHPEFNFLFGGQQQQQNGGYQPHPHQQQQQQRAGVPAGQQQQQQRYAGAGRVVANRSPEQFFRERADDSNPFWMSAVEGDGVGMLGTTAVLQAPPGRKGSFTMANCELSVVLGPQQLLQVRAA